MKAVENREKVGKKRRRDRGQYYIRGLRACGMKAVENHEKVGKKRRRTGPLLYLRIEPERMGDETG